jgi:diguanylate cyclase (GGDEF)-like protein/PAS domain S-box-containing protein
MEPDIPASPADPGQELEDYVRAERLSLLTLDREDQSIGLLAIAISVGVLRHLYPVWVLSVWAGLSGVMVLLSVYLANRCHKGTHSVQAVRNWARLFTGGAIITGLLWGVTGSAILLSPNIGVQSFVIVIAGAFMAGGVTGNAAYRPALLGLGLGIQIPIIIAVFACADRAHIGVGLMLIVFTTIMINSAQKFNGLIGDNIRLRFGQNQLLGKLQSSEAAMAEAQQLAMAGNWSLELKTRIISLSPEAYGIFGIDPANRAPDFSLIMDRVHRDDKAVVEGCVAASMTTGEVASLDHRLVMDDYTIKYLHIGAKTVFGASGQPIRITGSVQDVTDRKLIEDRLQFANSLLSAEMAEKQVTEDHLQFANILLNTQMEASPDGIQVANAQREMISFNHHFAEIWRVPPAEMKIGNDAFLRPHMIAQVKSPESYAARIEYLINHPDEAGEDDILLADGRTLERHTRPLRAADGTDLGRVWFFRDITARCLAAQKLEFTNILLKTKMEASRDGIMVIDSDNKVIALNQRYGKMTDTCVDDLVGQDLYVAVERVRRSLKDQDALLRRAASVAANPLEASEAAFEMADGRFITRYMAPLRAANGDYLGRAFFYSDVTERKQAENIIAYRDHLLHTVTAATSVAVSALSLVEGVNAALAKIGETMAVDRIIVIQHAAQEEPPLAVRFLWESPAVQTTFVLSATGPHKFNPRELAAWRAPLLQGEPVIAQRKTALGAVRAMLEHHGTESVLLMPIFVAGEAWGYLGINTCTAPRDWAASEIETVGILADITGSLIVRERARIALETSEQRFRLLTSTARDAVTLTDDTAVIRQWNHAAEQLFGYSADEVLDKNIIALLGRRGQKAEIAEILKTVTESNGLTMELSLRRKNGDEVAVEISVSAANVAGRREFVTIMRDISERKLAEQKLQFANILLNTQMEASPDGILVVDSAGKITAFNHRYAKVSQTGIDDLHGRDFSVAFDRLSAVVKDPAAFLRHVSFRPGNLSPTAAEEFEMADGRFISRYMTPLIAANGDYLGRAAFYTDITETKTAAQKLQFANTLLTTQMNASPDGTLVVDANTRIISCNRRFTTMWNIPDDLLIAGDDGPILSAVTSAMKNPDEFIDRVRYLYDHPYEDGFDELETIDGRLIDRHTEVIRTSAGAYLGRVWFFRDTTEAKTAAQKQQFTNILLSTQMEASPDGILVVDASRNMVSCNQRFCEIWGLPDGGANSGNDPALRAHIIAQVASPEAYQARIDYLVAHPEAIGDDEILTTDGRTIERFSQSLTSPSGEHIGRVWFFSDVTQRKLEAQRLMLSNALLKTQMEASPDGIYVVGKDREVLSYNQRFIDMFSLSEVQMLSAQRGWLRQEVSKLLKDPEPFITRIAHLNLHPGETADDILETIDGRTIEQHSVSLLAPGRNLGRAWFYRDITARRAAESLALRLARYDVLTGLANRALFVEAVNQAIAHARRDGTGFAVLFLDLDHFKDVNDTLGHPAGDALLKGVAARLKAATRETDTVGRFGGDEFAVILSGIQDAAGAGLLAEKLIAAINIPMAVELSTIHVRASIGIEIFSPSAEDSETLLGHADVALYRAKAEGRGTFRFFTAEMDRDVRSRVTLGAELREALAAGEFFLLYQPQVEAATGRLTGLEALIRWRHPTRGILLPETFIGAAEAAGAIAQLGHFVLWATCRQAAAWRNDGLELPRISFNVSALQFKGSIALEADIAEALAEYALPARVLELELTESILMDTSRENNDILRRLKTRGIKLAIDDFGTGYSSLEYLRRFPVDHIKIAQTFIKNIETEASDATIVRAIIGLANELGISTIAEGIENRAQMDLIASWGCTHMQGFYFSRPRPPEDITALLAAGGILSPRHQANTVIARSAATKQSIFLPTPDD